MSALTVHFRDLKDLLGEPADVLVLRDADHLPDDDGAGGCGRTLLNLNPFTHLAISYQEMLFYDGPYGHWRWLIALLAWRSVALFLFGLLPVRSAAGLVRGGGLMSAPRSRSTPVDVTKVYRRYAHKKQFATLKSALLSAAA